LGVGLTTLRCKKENVEKPPRNSAGFCGGGQGLSWAVEPRKEERRILKILTGVSWEVSILREDAGSRFLRRVG
jgi:hypothetical protein